MPVDVISPGGATSGAVAARLNRIGGDWRKLRPFLGRDGKTYRNEVIRNRWGEVEVDGKGIPKERTVRADNAFGLLLREDWIRLDEEIVTAFRKRLAMVNLLRAAGLTYNLPDAMGTILIQYQRSGRITPAVIGMDPLKRSEADRPIHDIVGLPIPIIWKDFEFSARELAVSANTRAPLDTSTGVEAAFNCAELAEQTVIGTAPTVSFAQSSVYGVMNFPQRTTGSLTYAPTNVSWTPNTLINDLQTMIDAMITANRFGPYVLLVGRGWRKYLEADYVNLVTGQARVGGTITLRQRLLMIDNIQAIVNLDYMPTNAYDLVLVQWDKMTIELIVGMDVRTVQWTTEGGFLENFKTLCCFVPRLRCDINNSCGIVHYS